MSAALNRDHIPTELKQLPQWVFWQYETRSDRKGGTRRTKVPCQADGRRASSTNRQTWCSYESAAAILAENPQKFAGIGFVFAKDDLYCGVDLDNSLKQGGSLKPWAEEIVREFAGGHVEVSPSRCGIKIWARGKLHGAGKRIAISDSERIELYDRGRFFAVTGRLYGSAVEVIGDHQAQIDGLYGWLIQRRAPGAPERPRETYSEGARHNALLREAGRQALRFCGEPAKTFDAVRQFNLARCRPPKDEREIQSIVEWACSQERLNKSLCGSGANWHDRLIVNQNGNPKPILANAIAALRYAPDWCSVLAFNEFSIGTAALKPPPWNAAQSLAEWTDHEDRLTGDWLQHAGIISFSGNCGTSRPSRRKRPMLPSRPGILGFAEVGRNQEN